MDSYTVLRVLGDGSFGRVLLVRQESSTQMCAMKEIRLPKVTAKLSTELCESVHSV